MIKSICVVCKKEFLIRQCKLQPNGNCCSRSCFFNRKKHKTGEIRQCVVCSKEFYCFPSRDNAKYCSQKCNAKNKKRKQSKLCTACDKLFVPNRKLQKYCSIGCRNSITTGRQLPCVLCQKPVFVSRCKLKQNTIFCSTEHAKIYSKRNQLPLVCKVCDAIFYVSKSSYKTRLCCSMKCLRNLKTNKLEELSYVMLDKLNIKYIKQHMIANKFTVDAYLPDLKLIIQFDGDYWHGNPSYYDKLNALQIKNQLRDKSMDNYLIKCGFKIMRFWEHDIKSNDKIFECIGGCNVA